MDYYRLARLIKSVIYNFMRMFKYMSYCLITICFIAICLLLMTSHSKAETLDFNFKSQYFYMDDTILNKFYNTQYYSKDYYYLITSTGSGSSTYYYVIAVPTSSGVEWIGKYNYINNELTLNPDINEYWYARLRLNGEMVFSFYQRNLHDALDATLKNPSWSTIDGNTHHWVWGTYESFFCYRIYNGAETLVTRRYFPNQIDYSYVFVSPYMTPNDTEGLQYLQTGEFTFFAINPRQFANF